MAWKEKRLADVRPEWWFREVFGKQREMSSKGLRKQEDLLHTVGPERRTASSLLVPSGESKQRRRD